MKLEKALELHKAKTITLKSNSKKGWLKIKSKHSKAFLRKMLNEDVLKISFEPITENLEILLK